MGDGALMVSQLSKSLMASASANVFASYFHGSFRCVLSAILRSRDVSSHFGLELFI